MGLQIKFDLSVILAFLKKSKVFLVPIVICLGAVIVLVPTVLLGNKVKKEADASGKRGAEISRMLSSDTSYSRQQVEVTEAWMKRYESDVDKVLELSKQTTQRELVSYNIFPVPDSTSYQVYEDFGASYQAAIESLYDKLGALNAPSDMEKNDATAHLTGNNDAFGVGDNRIFGGTREDASEAVNNVIDALCQKRASEIPVYGKISLFRWYDYWDDFTYSTTSSAMNDCWSSQVAYWVYDDIVDTITSLNGNSTRVADSLVKRLVDINFCGESGISVLSEGVDTTGGIRGGFGGTRRSLNRTSSVKDLPVYIIDYKDGPFDVPNWTGRSSDSKIDVIQFSFTVVLNSSAVPSFIKELASEKEHRFREGYSVNGREDTFKHNQITILSYQSIPVQLDAPEHADFRYGNQQVIVLELICEYIFQKAGYQSIMPKVVADTLPAIAADQK